MSNINNLQERFSAIQAADQQSGLALVREKAFQDFNQRGIPSVKHEEWKYTRVSSLFEKEFELAGKVNGSVSPADLAPFRIPGDEQANVIVFVNGIYHAGLSVIRSSGLVAMPLEQAAASPEYRQLVTAQFNHSAKYLPDGINALNTAFVHGGLFLFVPKGKTIGETVYIYNVTDARSLNVLAQPRSLVYLSERAELEIAETYGTIGTSDSITNQVMEAVVEKDAFFYYYKIQHDAAQASQVSTTHVRQIGKSFSQTVTISLDGSIVRNNLQAVLDAAFSEAHLYGLYFNQGDSHIDNHTLVDHAQPNCESNELYKGILDDNATGVFNGKIFVRKDAQKTNAFQSNKNILLSEGASVNTKPQLEIFADDVKCSHGCTVGSLDEEGLFYLQSRGISRQRAMSLLLQGFAVDVINKIKAPAVRDYVEALIAERLSKKA